MLLINITNCCCIVILQALCVVRVCLCVYITVRLRVLDVTVLQWFTVVHLLFLILIFTVVQCQSIPLTELHQPGLSVVTLGGSATLLGLKPHSQHTPLKTHHIQLNLANSLLCKTTFRLE